MAVKHCSRLCGKYLYYTQECEKCGYNEETNQYAKEIREKEEQERKMWDGQQ